MDVPIEFELAAAPLLLHPWHPSDAPALHEAVHESVATVGRWLPWCHAGYDLAHAEAWIDHCREGWLAQEHFAFAIIEQAGGTLLGSVGLNQRNHVHRSAAMGYWIRQSRQGEGVARQAARMAARFGFAALELVRIEIVALADNHASRRVAEACGARFEAIARHRLWERGVARDAAVYAVVPQDIGLT